MADVSPLLAPPVEFLFATRLYRAEIADEPDLNAALLAACLDAEAVDAEGRAWSERNGYTGYTSFESIDDLARRYAEVGRLSEIAGTHAQRFARMLDWDLGTKRRLAMSSLWINILNPGGFHGSHLHPLSVLSGTYYVSVPPGASTISFEDPRLPLMMGAPPRREGCARESRSHVGVVPRPGSLLMWESWLRHEVTLNRAEERRVSISFNFSWR